MAERGRKAGVVSKGSDYPEAGGRKARGLVSCLLCFGFCVGATALRAQSLPPGPGQPAARASMPTPGPDAALRRQAAADFISAVSAGAGEPARAAYSDDGYLRSFGAPPSSPVKTGAGASAPPATAATTFLKENAALFHEKTPALGSRIIREKAAGGRAFIRLQQTFSGVPVFGAETIVQLETKTNGVGNVISDIMRSPSEAGAAALNLLPALAPEEAERIVLERWRTAHPHAEVRIHQSPALHIYCPSVVGNSGAARLVWKLAVSGRGAEPVADLVLLDAHSGETALQHPLIYNARAREVRDSQNTSEDPGLLARSESDPPAGDADVDLAFDYLGDTYDFYAENHGRDSLDDGGLTLTANVRYCPLGYPCPMSNAFWDSTTQRMYFGAGYGAADDVVAHELTHAVTNHESALIYVNESGAINESFSDMWGEWVDLGNGGGDDSTEARWLIGEDLPNGGAIRDMADPGAMELPQPDRTGSPHWHTGTEDYGGVHINSGVGNKLCYLLTDGDVFNGRTVTGMGAARAAQLFYEVQTNLLVAASDYLDFHAQLTQAAINLDFTLEERANIEQACLAVEIAALQRPANDAFANAMSISGTTGSLAGSNVRATREPGEPTHADYGASSVWFAWTPSTSGTATLSTLGSDFDTLLGVYTGDSVTALTRVARNDQSPLGGSTSRVSFPVAAGIRYMIALDGYYGFSGAYSLQWNVQRCNLVPTRPYGWPDRIVVSDSKGTSVDSSPLDPTDALYVDFAVANLGPGETGSGWAVQLFVDGSLAETWTRNASLAADHRFDVLDYNIGSLPAGAHTLRLVVDPADQHSESNEGDNRFEKTVIVTPCTYSLSAAGSAIPAAGGVGSIALSAGDGCAWSASTGEAWIAILAGTDAGSGSDTIFYSVAPNSGPSPRSGTITVGGRIFGIAQAGASPAAASRFRTRQQTLVDSSGDGYQELVYIYSTGETYVSPYQNADGGVGYDLPAGQWTGIYHYDYTTARFSQASYRGKLPR